MPAWEHTTGSCLMRLQRRSHVQLSRGFPYKLHPRCVSCASLAFSLSIPGACLSLSRGLLQPIKKAAEKQWCGRLLEMNICAHMVLQAFLECAVPCHMLANCAAQNYNHVCWSRLRGLTRK